MGGGCECISNLVSVRWGGVGARDGQRHGGEESKRSRHVKGDCDGISMRIGGMVI